MTTSLSAPATTPAFQHVSLARKAKNGVATVLVWLSFVVAVVPLVWVLYTVIAKGASTISWSFLTGSPIPPNVVPVGIGGSVGAPMRVVETPVTRARSAA